MDNDVPTKMLILIGTVSLARLAEDPIKKVLARELTGRFEQGKNVRAGRTTAGITKPTQEGIYEMNLETSKAVSDLVELQQNDAASFIRVLTAAEVVAVAGCGTKTTAVIDLGP